MNKRLDFIYLQQGICLQFIDFPGQDKGHHLCSKSERQDIEICHGFLHSKAIRKILGRHMMGKSSRAKRPGNPESKNKVTRFSLPYLDAFGPGHLLGSLGGQID